jgi:hypothetical protein
MNTKKKKYSVSGLKKSVTESVAERLAITIESQLVDLEKIKQMAMEDKQLKVAISAIAEQNKMLGFYSPEKKDVSITGIQIVTKDQEMSELVESLNESGEEVTND